MEIPSVVDSVEHSASGSQTLAAQELNPERSILSEKEDYCDHDLPPQEQKSLFGNDKEIQIQNKGLDFVHQGNTESSREPESAFLTSSEAPMEARPPPPPSAEVHDADMVSYNSCCSDVALPVSAPEGWSDRVDQNITGQILSCEPKGYVRSLESSLTLVAHPNGLDAAQNFPPVPRIVNHKQSSITFLAHTKSSDAEDQSLGNTGSENGEQECVPLRDDIENDDYEDDVFNELPARGEFFLIHGSSHSEMRGVGSVEATRNRGWEAEEEANSPWSESMSRLMMKLDQLNLDIEEALSENSSPCGTPGTVRKKQSDAVSKSTSDQSPQDHRRPRGDRGECSIQEESSAPLRTSEGASTTVKRTVVNKMTSAARAAGLRRPL